MNQVTCKTIHGLGVGVNDLCPTFMPGLETGSRSESPVVSSNGLVIVPPGLIIIVMRSVHV